MNWSAKSCCKFQQNDDAYYMYSILADAFVYIGQRSTYEVGKPAKRSLHNERELDLNVAPFKNKCLECHQQLNNIRRRWHRWTLGITINIIFNVKCHAIQYMNLPLPNKPPPPGARGQRHLQGFGCRCYRFLPFLSLLSTFARFFKQAGLFKLEMSYSSSKIFVTNISPLP